MTQTEFAAALLNPNQATPKNLRDPQGGPAGRRFNVYRNNVAASLRDALSQAFPALRSLIGTQRFDALADMFFRAHPPSDPRMLRYGAHMGTFLRNFAPLAQYPYLPDVADLESAIRTSYHGPDSTAIAPEQLLDLDETELAHIGINLSPTLTVIHSSWPILSIWKAAQDPDAPKPQMQSEIVCLTRPALDVTLTVISAPLAAALDSLAQGDPIARACDQCDAAELFQFLLAEQAITSFTKV